MAEQQYQIRVGLSTVDEGVEVGYVAAGPAVAESDDWDTVWMFAFRLREAAEKLAKEYGIPYGTAARSG